MTNLENKLESDETNNNLAARTARTESNDPGDSLLADVESRALHLGLADLLRQDGGQHADDDLVPLVNLGRA